jgi:hypothetical protein
LISKLQKQQFSNFLGLFCTLPSMLRTKVAATEPRTLKLVRRTQYLIPVLKAKASPCSGCGAALHNKNDTVSREHKILKTGSEKPESFSKCPISY